MVATVITIGAAVIVMAAVMNRRVERMRRRCIMKAAHDEELIMQRLSSHAVTPITYNAVLWGNEVEVVMCGRNTMYRSVVVKRFTDEDRDYNMREAQELIENLKTA